MTDFIDASTGEVLPGTEDNVTVAFAIYMHEAAKQQHWVKHRRLIKPWRVSIKERMDEHDGIASWREAITIAARSDFLSGRILGARGRFQLDINFLVQPRSFAKILDGFYTREQGPTTQKLTLPTLMTPPQKPQPAFVPESIDVRELSMIASYRRHGKFADANRIEEQRAKRLGTPPVLVPAPEVAREGLPEETRPVVKKPAAFTDVVPDWTAEDVPASAYHEAEA